MGRHLVYLAISGLVISILNCSSDPPAREKPDWISQPTRVVDNGYIVYIGSGEEVSADQAELAAEGMAIQDLANECAFIPKGTRVEDRFSEKQKNTYKAYAKVAIEIQICDQAQKTVNPADIKNLASLPFTEELKRFQDNIQNNSDEVVDSGVEAPQVAQGGSSGGSSGGIQSGVHFFVVRQYVAYQNQVVILSPPTYYAPGSPEAVTYANRVVPVRENLQTYAQQNPAIAKSPQTWSSVAPQARAQHPQAFSNRSRPQNRQGGVRPPSRPAMKPGQGHPYSQPMGRRRRRSNENGF
jgi:hypothetical protein